MVGIVSQLQTVKRRITFWASRTSIPRRLKPRWFPRPAANNLFSRICHFRRPAAADYDLGHNRILIWNTIPTQTAAPADLVIGQPDMVSDADNNTPKLCDSNGKDGSGNPIYPPRCGATLSFPRFALSDGTRLFVADGGNDRRASVQTPSRLRMGKMRMSFSGRPTYSATLLRTVLIPSGRIQTYFVPVRIQSGRRWLLHSTAPIYTSATHSTGAYWSSLPASPLFPLPESPTRPAGRFSR